MRIKTLPENYAGVLAPVVYEIDQADPAEIISVRIPGDDDEQIVGEKRLTGETEYTVNISNYLEARIAVEPVSGQWLGLGKAAKRSCTARIAVGGQASSVTQATGGCEVCPAGAILSESPTPCRIAFGEKDEIAVIAPGLRLTAKATMFRNDGASTEVALGNIICGDGIYVLVVDTEYVGSYLADGFGTYARMEVEITGGETVTVKRVYEIVPARPNTTRLCWQNRYGQVDYYTFATAETSIDISKSRSYLAQGYRAVGMTRDTVRRLVSECEPRSTIEWLSGILSSPQVWIAGRDGFAPVDVMSDNAVIHNGQPISLEITVRDAKRKTLKQA